MLFKFLTYLQPTHYFQLFTKANTSVFPIVKSIPESVLLQLTVDTTYTSTLAQDYDLSWQAVQKGYIGEAPTYTTFEKLSAQDNYHFIRKYFNKAWVFYVLVLRLFSFKNPFKEITAWLKTRQVQRVSIGSNPIVYNDYNTFESALIKENQKVSVVIPTLNRYDYLKAVLKDLEQQDYSNFEVIVVDQSEPFHPDFYKDYTLDINLVRQEEKALWLARNNAIKNAKGAFIALSEDDVRIAPNWISSHLKCLDYFKAEVSAGVFYPEGKQIPKDRAFFAIASQFATGNAVLYKSVFEKVGLFDRQFEKQRMGDGEFGMRVYLQGIKSVSNPIASCIDVKAGTGGLREMGSWDAFRPSNFFAPRPIPSVLYFFRRYFGNKAARLAMLRTIPISIFPYQFKKNKSLLVLGSVLTVLILPLVFYQVFTSWRLASKKLQEGDKIGEL
ncbi:glycosyltransferase family 2 protein [Lacinutrix sp. C3R15]|uniref:glycosyltransferase family 2 protein n=1 Tax=Flavobacteriaceae TaxID=49546 RepID=UPI001C089ECD|nr:MULTISPECIES: glycosyltransferase family A protein [Flavobacteriaceae]MBU2939586.1 glycosyltransferase family 2 protein [Lacinutrix sp. C3R15]MDO6622900.1 glycosyltransferase family A protein [Oceanihabitans sp. 1_MG-2023]